MRGKINWGGDIRVLRILRRKKEEVGEGCVNLQIRIMRSFIIYQKTKTKLRGL
jgi:hypothetical protein